MSAKRLLTRFLIWRNKNIRNKNFVYVLAVLIGLISGLAAVTLTAAVDTFKALLTGEYGINFPDFLYFAYPAIGIMLTATFIIYVNKGKIGGGISNILYVISRKSSIIPRDKTYSHMITSAFTVGFGGSVGLEAPIVTTGSAIGSNLGRYLNLDVKTRTLLIGCGAAGAIGAIFNAPITGVLFALEVLFLDLTAAALIALLLSSVAGTLMSHLLLGEEILFNLELQPHFQLNEIPYYILLGVLSGFLSVYFTRVILSVENRFLRFRSRYVRGLIGASILGVILFMLPSLFGEGYDTVNAILHDNPTEILPAWFEGSDLSTAWVLLAMALILVFMKAIAASITFGAGGVGGIIAPSLFTGALFGYSFSHFFNLTHFTNDLPESHFALVGMAGVLSGVLHAPLMSIFMIFEITMSYGLMLPLMIVGGISMLTSKLIEPYSIYAVQLGRKGHFIGTDKDKAVLHHLDIERVIETDLLTIGPEEDLGCLVEVVSKSKRNIYPVVSPDGKLVGIITLDDIRTMMFRSEMYKTVKVRELLHPPPATVNIDESMDVVMQKFEDCGAWNLPVIKDGKYAGFLSKSKIFNIYRRLLIHHSRDE